MIACLANTFRNIELATEGANFAANSVLIEEITFGTFKALVLAPCFASIVIGDGDKLREWYFATLFIEATELSVERGEGQIAMG